LAQYLEKSGESQTAFARRIGVSQSYISRIANGIQNPPLDLALRIADLANIPIESLVHNASPAQPLAGDVHD